ncbi:MAG: hypothetical protein IJW00_08815 [Clostridia bacterium]|nr:hypothetical protein [Clostridia bacterium]
MKEARTDTSVKTSKATRDSRLCKRVEDAICRRAEGYKVELRKTLKVKRVDYDPDTGKKTCEREELMPGVEEIHVPGDVRAAAYFLNNRDPERWCEHPNTAEESGELSGIVEIPAVAHDGEGSDEDGAGNG